MTLYAGASRMDITPPPGLPMAGYVDRKGLAVGAHDPLYVRALYVGDEGCELVFLLLDLVRVEGVLLDSVKRSVEAATGVKNVIIAATHTHSGPEVSLGMWSTQDVGLKRGEVEEYIRFVARRCASVALEAVERAEPVEIAISRGMAKGIATNRIDPSKAIDEEVVTLSLWGSSGLVAILSNFACHPTVLSALNTLYSGDFFGFAASEAEEALGRTVIVSNGAAGNVSTRFSRTGCGFDEVARMGRNLALAILGSVIEDGGAKCKDCIQVYTVRRSFKAREIPSLSELEEMKERVSAEIEKAKREGVKDGYLRVLLSKLYAFEVLAKRLRFGIPSRVDVEVSVVRLCNTYIVTFPGELFVEYQLRLKELGRAKGKNMVLVGYANGYVGYVPYKTYSSVECYETLVSLIDPSEYEAVEEFLLEAVGK